MPAEPAQLWIVVRCGTKIVMQILWGTYSCRNALRSNLQAKVWFHHWVKKEKGREAGTANKEKQAVIRLHLNLPKLNGLIRGWRGNCNNKHTSWQNRAPFMTSWTITCTHLYRETRDGVDQISLSHSTQQMVVGLSLFVPWNFGADREKKVSLIIYSL